jgi:DNA-binding NtrC family response regulator
VEAPSFRERREDFPALIDHFIRRFNVEEGKRVSGVSAEAMQLLCAYDWPGNVRQLENTVYRAIVLADSPHLQAFDFPAISGQMAPQITAMPVSEPLVLSADVHIADDHDPLHDAPVRILDEAGHLRKLEDIERDLIEHAIGVYAGHMSEVARRLGIGRSTLYRKVRDCGLEGLVKEAG